MSQQYLPPTNSSYSHSVPLNILWEFNLLIGKGINRNPEKEQKQIVT